MKVTFSNALCCDVDEVKYDNKLYYSVILYSYDDKSFYRVSIPSDISVDDVRDLLCHTVYCEARLSTFDGKNKFKLLSIQNA